MDMEIAKSLTNGGRALQAVWDMPFTPHQKLFLLYLGSQLDFTCDETRRHRYHRIEPVADKIGIAEGTLRQVVDTLVRQKYVEYNEDEGITLDRVMTNSYRLTEKIWSEYAEVLRLRRG